MTGEHHTHRPTEPRQDPRPDPRPDPREPPVFSPREIGAVLDAFGLGRPVAARAFARGNPAAPKAWVDLGDRVLLVKRRAPGADAASRVALEHRTQRTLAAAGLPVPQPLADARGRTVLALDGSVYEVFPFVEGGAWRRTPAAAEAAGRLLGAMHAVLAPLGIPDAAAHGRGASAPVGAAEQAMAWAEANVPGVAADIEHLRRDDRAARLVLAERCLRPAVRCLVHGDYHPGNLVWHGDEVAAVVDFENLGPGSPGTEAASAALFFGLDWEAGDPDGWAEAPDPDRLAAFWTGYRRAAGQAGQDDTEAAPSVMVSALIAEGLPRACSPGGLRGHPPERVIPCLARTAGWLTEHASGIAAVLDAGTP